MIKLTFNQKGIFHALYAAQDWCTKNGISCGSLCGYDPVGLLYGHVLIAKWRNLTDTERSQLDGKMTSPDFRYGPVTIEIREKP
jgi:hypothetical protein